MVRVAVAGAAGRMGEAVCEAVQGAADMELSGRADPLLGTTLGLLAGYYRGWIEILVMRAVDLQLAFPFILLALSIVALMGARCATSSSYSRSRPGPCTRGPPAAPSSFCGRWSTCRPPAAWGRVTGAFSGGTWRRAC